MAPFAFRPNSLTSVSAATAPYLPPSSVRHVARREVALLQTSDCTALTMADVLHFLPGKIPRKINEKKPINLPVNSVSQRRYREANIKNINNINIKNIKNNIKRIHTARCLCLFSAPCIKPKLAVNRKYCHENVYRHLPFSVLQNRAGTSNRTHILFSRRPLALQHQETLTSPYLPLYILSLNLEV